MRKLRDGEQIPLDHSGERYTVGFWIGSYQKEYACEGHRAGRPFYALISEAFKTTNIMLFCVSGLAGCLIIFITMVVLAFRCIKKCRPSVRRSLPSEAMHEEIDPTTETQGSPAVIGQHPLYATIQFRPLNQGSQAVIRQQHPIYSTIQSRPLTQGTAV
ncbi:hypothetical protein AAFF_G00391030 [Aldrovandia affinis]|uniref:Uncharacterized protein n=1 Tax=Aldrovandia affinis TaxID=143900 RepID=A0AAD7VYV7_9TELE|nr:hypothetical protein AAFF_G00391030 [Aldrovandia affinis]